MPIELVNASPIRSALVDHVNPRVGKNLVPEIVFISVCFKTKNASHDETLGEVFGHVANTVSDMKK